MQVARFLKSSRCELNYQMLRTVLAASCTTPIYKFGTGASALAVASSLTSTGAR